MRAFIKVAPRVLSEAIKQYVSSFEDSIRIEIEEEIKSDLSFKDWETMWIEAKPQQIMSILGVLADMGENGLVRVE